MEQEASTHAGETKYEGRRRGERGGRRRNRIEWGCGADTGVSPDEQGVVRRALARGGTQIVGGPKIRVGWVEGSFFGIRGRGKKRYRVGCRTR